MNRALSLIIWSVVVLLGVFAYSVLAVQRNEPVNSAYMLIAAVCTYAIGYRFYSKWIAAYALMLDDRRATPCEIHEDGKDFVKTNRWIVFGHHFAAISGPGPLVGPVLAAQFGYLPGTIWILIGVVLGGAVQDFIILVASMRRDGRSLARMLRDELTRTVGIVGTISILAIMIIILAVLALVVVKALAESPWGVFTVGATIPIAMFMGGYLRWIRPGRVMEVSVIGVLLLFAAVWGGQAVHADPHWHHFFLLKAEPLAWMVVIYGFLASVLPVWLLLAPRDYLSTFMKLGTIGALAVGTLLVLPELRMPAVSKFVDGSGLVVGGPLFPFCFITIACGAISGFHTLIASGITPKIITREGHARPVGYGAMCLESLVAIMAMIAACTLDPGVYLGMNVAGNDPAATAAKVAQTEFTALAPVPGGKGYTMEKVTVSEETMRTLAKDMGEVTLYGRTGGAATLAVGMASIFGKLTGGKWMDLWYHFALMFEALFILTTLDAGTRVGRYLLQDGLRNIFPALSRVDSVWAGAATSAMIVLAWGFFLIAGVRDPDGGVKALWPIFGIANQLLASIALCLATTILLKYSLRRGKSPALALVTGIPLVILLCITVTAGVMKVGHSNKGIGFIAAAKDAAAKIPAAETRVKVEPGEASAKALKSLQTAQINNWVDAGVTIAFLALAATVVALTVLEWIRLWRRERQPDLSETEPVYLSDAALSLEKGVPVMSVAALGFALLRDLSGEAAIDRVEAQLIACACQTPEAGEGQASTPTAPKNFRKNAFLTATSQRYGPGMNRCC